MNKDQARKLFLDGGAHPNCPECSSNILHILGTAQRGGETWNIYRCPNCKTNFKATIDMSEPVDVTV